MKNKYKKLYIPNHPNAGKDGKIFEHIYIASEIILKRPLNKGEIVHHINGKKIR